MKRKNSNITLLERKILVILIVFTSCFNAYSQNYTKDIVRLWDKENIPFNKENIKLKETVDSTGGRYTQISDPVLYIYRKKGTISKGPALLYCPGGGYATVSIGKGHGESYAKLFFKMGFNVVAVLKYRLPDSRIVDNQEKVPLCDAQKALSLLHRNAEKWKIDRSKIGVKGASAGGHLVASLNNLSEDILAPGVKPDELYQAFSILRAPVITFNLPLRHNGSYKRLLGDKATNLALLDFYSMENQVSQNTPPTFLVNAIDDISVAYQNSTVYTDSLKTHGVVNKYVQLKKGGHGFGLNFSKTGVDWTVDLEAWLKKEIKLFDNQKSNNIHSTSGLKIILKLDDLAVKDGVCKSLPIFKLLEKKQIKASFGIIPARCDGTLQKTLSPYLNSVNNKGEKLFEIWHHGYDHIKPEFYGTDYSYQKAHFNQADSIIKEALDIQMHSFGSPANASDSITNKVISENPEYKVFMFSKNIPTNTKGVLYLNNRTNMENGTGNIDFNFFVENYKKNKDKYSDYMILQGHPKMWSTEQIKQFEQVIDFLISEKCEFVLPYEYFLSELSNN